MAIRDLKHVAWKGIWRARLLWLGNEKAKKGTRSNLWILERQLKHTGEKFFSIGIEGKSGRSYALRGSNWAS